MGPGPAGASAALPVPRADAGGLLVLVHAGILMIMIMIMISMPPTLGIAFPFDCREKGNTFRQQPRLVLSDDWHKGKREKGRVSV